MTDRQLTNPLKGTVSPLVKIVPGYASSPEIIRTKSKLEMLYWLAITQIWWKKWLPPPSISDVCQNLSKISFDCSVTARCWSEMDVCLVFFLWASAILSSPNMFPFLHYSKTSAVWNVWSSITPQNPISARNCVIKPGFRAALLCFAADQGSPLLNDFFHMGFKTDFIKCSISKWASHHSRKVKATLATWAVAQY